MPKPPYKSHLGRLTAEPMDKIVKRCEPRPKKFFYLKYFSIYLIQEYLLTLFDHFQRKVREQLNT